MTHAVDNTDFWESRYNESHTPWDIGQVAPAFIKYLNKLRAESPELNSKKICVLGCGLGHDAFYFAENVYEVHAFDFSDNAIKKCNERKNKKGIKDIYFYQEDFFNLQSQKKFENYFDLVIEHTSLCAINPKRRDEYVELIKYLLKPHGQLIGLFFIREELGGPPYGTNEKELRSLLKDFKEIEKLHFEECLHTNFDGVEYFGIFEKVS